MTCGVGATIGSRTTRPKSLRRGAHNADSVRIRGRPVCEPWAVASDLGSGEFEVHRNVGVMDGPTLRAAHLPQPDHLNRLLTYRKRKV
jgi:hypothetical protein